MWVSWRQLSPVPPSDQFFPRCLWMSFSRCSCWSHDGSLLKTLDSPHYSVSSWMTMTFMSCLTQGWGMLSILKECLLRPVPVLESAPWHLFPFEGRESKCLLSLLLSSTSTHEGFRSLQLERKKILTIAKRSILPFSNNSNNHPYKGCTAQTCPIWIFRHTQEHWAASH